MNVILLFNIGTILIALSGMALLIMPSGKPVVNSNTRAVLLFLMVLVVFTAFSNVLEWSEITPELDVYEDYTELLLPVAWIFLFIGLLQDMDHRRIEASEERYRAISELTSDYVYSLRLTDRGDFTDLWLGGAFEKITGYSIKEIKTYEDWLTMIHEEDRTASTRSLNDSLDNRVTKVEYRLERPDGKVLWLRDVRHPMYDTRLARVVRVYGSVQDITESKQKSEELRESEDRLNRAQALAHVGNWEIDLRTGTMWASAEAFRIYGLPRRSEFLPLAYIQGAVHPDDRGAMDQALKDLIEKNKRYEVSFRIYRFDDRSLRHLNSQAVLIRGESGKPEKVSGTIQDVTERKLLEEQYYHAQRMEAIGQFASGVAHDINNLITAINGHAELARMSLIEQGEEKIVQDIDEILGAADRVTSLNSRLLAFSRKPNQQQTELNINTVLISLEKMLHRIIGEEITLQTDLAIEELITFADVSYLEQVIMNLVVNARDAMPDGGMITLKTFARTVENELGAGDGNKYSGEYVVMSIKDTGIGMTSEVMSKIFEPFYTTKELGHGTGLGLATVFGVVKQLEGFIQVKSTPGKGTEFQVYMPRTERTGKESAAEKSFELTHHGDETIMIVEDDEVVRNLSASILTNHGYEIVVAPNGAEALSMVEKYEDDIQLVLTDVVMPMLRGPEMIEKLRLRWPELKVIYMSGYAAHSSGMIKPEDQFIEKPFTVQSLTKKIREVLDS